MFLSPLGSEFGEEEEEGPQTAEGGGSKASGWPGSGTTEGVALDIVTLFLNLAAPEFGHPPADIFPPQQLRAKL